VALESAHVRAIVSNTERTRRARQATVTSRLLHSAAAAAGGIKSIAVGRGPGAAGRLGIRSLLLFPQTGLGVRSSRGPMYPRLLVSLT
jgi:hypothetical protein